MYFQPLNSCADKMNADRSDVFILSLYTKMNLMIMIHYGILYGNKPQKGMKSALLCYSVFLIDTFIKYQDF